MVLYELLCGQRPIRPKDRTWKELERAVLETEPQSASKVNAAIDADLDVICAQAMAKEPSRRYQSVELMLEDVRRYLRG